MSDDQPTRYVLYSYWRSSCAWRVRIALEWKRQTFEYRAVHLVKGGGEQLSPEFARLNPNQRVPALDVGGHIIAQSGAAVEFLEEAHPERPLLPKDPLARADVRNLCGLIGCDTHPIQNLAVLRKAVENEPDELKDAKKAEWARFWIERGFRALEAELQRTAGKYCVGDSVTLADLYLVPQIYNARRFGVNVETEFPTITRIGAALDALPEFQRAHPSAQPDAVA